MYVTLFLSHQYPASPLPAEALVHVVAEVKDDVSPGGLLEQTLRPASHALLQRFRETHHLQGA